MLTIGGFAQIGQVSTRTLRHYDELGLLQPVRVDEATGYRYYEVVQLQRLHRLLALRDLGLSLDQIRSVLEDELSNEALRGMLRLRRTQVEALVAEEQARLRRIEARLRSLERSDMLQTNDVVVKTTLPLRIAEATGTAPGYGHENLRPVFDELYPCVAAALQRAGEEPGLCVAWYEESPADGSVKVHAGFSTSAAAIPGVAVVDLPTIEVASLVYRGAMDDIGASYDSLMRWIDANGFSLAGQSRELYYQLCLEGDPAQNVVELQLPISRK